MLWYIAAIAAVLVAVVGTPIISATSGERVVN
jgi:hypothetical protein